MTARNVDVDFKNSDVIKAIGHIGRTTYVNIVTGQRTDVEWGAGDWLGAIAIGCLMFVLFSMVAGLVTCGVLIATGVIR